MGHNLIIEYLRRERLRESHLAIIGKFTFILTLPEVAQDEERMLAPRVYFVIADPVDQCVQNAIVMLRFIDRLAAVVNRGIRRRIDR